MPEFRKHAVNSSSAQRRLLQAEAWLGLKSERGGWMFAVFSIFVATVVATPFWFFVSHQNLMLLYVLGEDQLIRFLARMGYAVTSAQMAATVDFSALPR